MENKGRNKGHDNLIPLKKGQTANPNGRPKGQRNYATIYREALKNIAKANDKTPEEIETMLEESGLKQAMKGNFQFWKDIRDRIHGKAQENIALSGKDLPTPIININGISGNNSNEKDTRAD